MHIRFHSSSRTTPETIDGFKVPYAAAKRVAPKWRWRLILAVVFSPVLYVAYSAGKELFTLSAEGAVSLAQYTVRAPSAGRTMRVAVTVGAKVVKGDILVQLDDPGLDADIAQRKAGAGNTGRMPPSGTSVALQEELELETRILHSAEQRLADVRDLLSQGAATAAEVREAQISADEAAAAVLRVRQRMRGLRGEAPSSASPELYRLLAAREQLTIRAPANGYVAEILTKDNEVVSAGSPLLLLSGDTEPEVLAYVRPELLKRVHTGSAATVRFPDGVKMQAVVGNGPFITQHTLAEPDSPFSGRSPTVVLHLQSREPWPAATRINGLPVAVRFHYEWEPSTQAFR